MKLMNIWGTSPFENEAAVDWLYDFGENDFRLIDRTLAGIAGMTAVDQLDTEEACEALVAAECVAAACGRPAANLPEEIEEWLAENSPMQVKPDYVTMAQQAVANVRAQSPLPGFWATQGQLAEWETAVADLQARLESERS